MNVQPAYRTKKRPWSSSVFSFRIDEEEKLPARPPSFASTALRCDQVEVIYCSCNQRQNDQENYANSHKGVRISPADWPEHKDTQIHKGECLVLSTLFLYYDFIFFWNLFSMMLLTLLRVHDQ